MIIVKDEILIDKDIASVWKVLTDVNNWGRWTRVIKHAAIYGPLQPGTRIKCLSHSWDFDAIISKIEPRVSLGLSGSSIGLHLNLVWQFQNTGNQTKVNIVAEITGWIPAVIPRKTRDALQDVLFTWLYALRTASESDKIQSGHPEKLPGTLSSKKPRPRPLSPLNFFLRIKNRDD